MHKIHRNKTQHRLDGQQQKGEHGKEVRGP